GQPATVATNQLTQLESASVVGFPAHWSGRARACLNQAEMIEQVVIGAAMTVTTMAAGHRLFRAVDNKCFSYLGAAFAVVRPTKSGNACDFGRRLARRTQLPAFCFRGLVVGRAFGTQNHAVNIYAYVLGYHAALDIGGHAVRIAE